MICNEKGVLPGSFYYFFTPSVTAENLFFYPFGCGHFYCTDGYDVNRSDYNNYLLMYIAKGKCGIESEGKSFIAVEGDLVFLNCHSPHRYYAINSLEIIWLHFDGSLADKIHKYVIKSRGIVFNIGKNTNVLEIMNSMIISRQNKKPLNETYFSWIIYQILCELVAPPVDFDSVDPLDDINHSIIYIKNNYANNLSLSDMAKDVNLSVFHFARQFKIRFGYSPYHYLINLRIDKAKVFLKTTAYPVKEIAYKVGFNSESNFVSSFSNKVGISPAKFRKCPL